MSKRPIYLKKVAKNTFLLFSKILLLGVLVMSAGGCGKYKVDNDIFKDQRDGEEYKIVTIGKQVWMAENLRYLPYVVRPDSNSKTSPFYYVYNYDGDDLAEAKATFEYATFGVLYNWKAATISCPSGWHLPSDKEWIKLADYLGGRTVAGGKLKETGTTHWYKTKNDVTNEFDFSALGGGRRYHNGTFNYITRIGYWWSSTEDYSYGSYSRMINYYENHLFSCLDLMEEGFSVRCIKD